MTIELTVASPTMKVRDARDMYMHENAFTMAEYTKPFVGLTVFKLRIPFPNVGGLGRALPFHDLHHVVLGYGTDFYGELEIMAWEMSAGLHGAPWIVRFIVLEGLVIGLFTAFRRTLAAWRAARGCRTLFRSPLPYDTLLDMTVGDLRAHMGIPPNGMTPTTPHAHARAPGASQVNATHVQGAY